MPRDFAYPDMKTDCSACSSLCCVALHFDRGTDFALDKPAGVACPNLDPQKFSCAIHDDLAKAGFTGCIKFDCLGAGQHTVQGVFGGTDWRAHPELLPEMMEVFRLLRRLHQSLEILKYLELMPLGDDKLHLVNMLKAGFTEPEDGWTMSTLTALETDGAFDLYHTALPAFQSLFDDPKALAALRAAT